MAVDMLITKKEETKRIKKKQDYKEKLKKSFNVNNKKNC